MELPTLNVVLKDQEDKAGFRPIIVNVTFQRKKKPVQTGFKAQPSNFDKFNLIGKGDPNYLYKNRIIRQQVADLERKYIRYVEDYGPLDFEAVRAIASGDKVVTGKTLRSVKDEVRKIYAKTLAPRTLKSWDTVVDLIEEFRPGMTISDLTDSFFMDFESHRRKDKKNNTVWADFKALSSFLSKAKKKRVIASNPLEGRDKPAYVKGVKVILEEDEVAEIEDYADNGRNAALKNVAAWFVFACRSGLRYEDLVAWDPAKHISRGKMYFSDQKEQTPHFIPIRPDLQRAIDRVEGTRIPSNQKCNNYIKEVADIKGIKKNISMHTARHTFAVDYLDKGGDIKVLQRLLGHKKLETTEVYGQISDKRIETENKRVYGY